MSECERQRFNCSGVGGKPLRTNESRRSNTSGFAGGAGLNPSLVNRARMNWSTAPRDHCGSFTLGGSTRFMGFKLHHWLRSMSSFAQVSSFEAAKAAKILVREVRAMAAVRHPIVVMLLGVCIDPGKLAIIMEYAEKGTLRDRLDEAGQKVLDARLQGHHSERKIAAATGLTRHAIGHATRGITSALSELLDPVS